MSDSLNESAVEIRPATRDDLPAIVALLARDSFLNPPPPSVPTPGLIAAFEATLSHPETYILVATLEGEVIGTLQLNFLPGLSHRGTWRAQVEAVRVRDDLRGRQIGTRMMEWVIAKSRERGCWLVQLTSNQSRRDAHRFYERLGFAGSHLGMRLYL